MEKHEFMVIPSFDTELQRCRDRLDEIESDMKQCQQRACQILKVEDGKVKVIVTTMTTSAVRRGP